MSETTKRHRFSILVLRLVLMVAILAATCAVLPAPVQTASAAGSKPVLTAKIQNTKILWVSGTSFVASRYYVITGRSPQGKVRLGKVQASKAGKIDVKYKLSGKLLTAKTIRVCAQDTAKGKTYCTTVKR